MSTLVIPDLDETTLAQLRAQAAREGRSEAEQARRILEDTLKPSISRPAPEQSLAAAMRGIFGPLGGHDFPPLRAAGARTPPDFSGPEYDR